MLRGVPGIMGKLQVLKVDQDLIDLHVGGGVDRIEDGREVGSRLLDQLHQLPAAIESTTALWRRREVPSLPQLLAVGPEPGGSALTAWPRARNTERSAEMALKRDEADLLAFGAGGPLGILPCACLGGEVSVSFPERTVVGALGSATIAADFFPNEVADLLAEDGAGLGSNAFC